MKKYLLEYKFQLLRLGLLLVIAAGLNVYSAVVMANIINELIAHNLPSFFRQILLWTAIWAIIIIIKFTLSILETNFEQGIANKMRADLVDAISNESYETYNKQDNTRFVSWMNNDTQQVTDKGLTYLYVVIDVISSIVLSLIALLSYSVWLMLLSIVLAVVVIALPKILNKKLDQTSIALTKENEKFVQVASDLLSSFNMLFSFNATNLMKRKINSESKELKNSYVAQAKVYGGISALGFIGNVTAQILLTGLTGFLAYQNIVKIGVIYSVSSLAGNIFNGVGNLPNYFGYIKSTEPIFEKFDKFINDNPVSHAQHNLPASEPYLAMKGVTFHYPNTKVDVIKDFSYNFEKNKKYMLDGDSGCGKSTILKLLAGLYPSYSGEILFAGHQLRDYPMDELHKNIFYLDQHAQVIKGTVRDNLNLTDHYTDEELLIVLQKVHLNEGHNFLDTKIEKGGSSLSGGQLQRLALARALLRNFKVFLFDEGTTGIEKNTAIELEQLLLKDPRKTVIVVNHSEAEENKKLFDNVINLSAEI